MQHLDGDGNSLWTTNGVYVCQHTTYEHWVIPDGQNGFVLQANPEEGMYNTAYRIGPAGIVIWTLPEVSYAWTASSPIPGEPGFFYTAYGWAGFFAQRIDMQGNTYWGNYSAWQPGTLVVPTPSGGGGDDNLNFYYRWPYLYASVAFEQFFLNREVHALYGQILDSTGTRVLADSGAFMGMVWPWNENWSTSMPNLEICADDAGGIVAAFQADHYPQVGTTQHDVWAKRCNLDGTLGPPTELPVPPVGNPPAGPSLSLNQFRYSLPGPSEVEAGLYDILGRERLAHRETVMASGSYILPFNTASLPSGIYLLRLRTRFGEAAGKVVMLK
jgi:hypothetical protein